MRRIGQIALATLLVLLAVGVVGGCGGGEETTLEVPLAESEEFVSADDVNVDPLVLQFAPVVWIHSREAYGPTSVARFLKRSELTWRTASRFSRDPDLARRGEVAAARLGDRCAGVGGGCYAHGAYLATDFTRPHDVRPARAPKLSEGDGFYLDPDNGARKGEVGAEPRAPIYYEISRHPQSTRITYWFFYGFSVPYKPAGPLNLARFFSHEGDWENIDVVLEADGSPRNVSYYGHGHPRPIAWAEACKLDADGEEDCGSAEPGRPIVFSARHSHASYPNEADGKSRETAVCHRKLRKLCSYDMRNRGFVWDPLSPAAGGLRDARAEPWYGFGGAWGSAGLKADTTGPLGPSGYKLPDEPEPGELKAVMAPQPPDE